MTSQFVCLVFCGLHSVVLLVRKTTWKLSYKLGWKAWTFEDDINLYVWVIPSVPLLCFDCFHWLQPKAWIVLRSAIRNGVNFSISTLTHSTSLLKWCDSHSLSADPLWSICFKNWRSALLPGGSSLPEIIAWMCPYQNLLHTQTVDENIIVKALMVLADRSRGSQRIRQSHSMIVWLEPDRFTESMLPVTCSQTMCPIMHRH